MNEEEYLVDRVDDQIAWYSSKSQTNKKCFLRCQIAAILASAAVPVFAQFLKLSWASVTVGALGAISAVIASIVSLYHFREHWVDYRTTAESLKHEKYMYLTKTGPYEGENNFSLFIQRVESLISQENTTWTQRLTTKKEERPHG